MDRKIEFTKIFKDVLIQADNRIFDLERDIIKIREELEDEKRYTHCLEKLIEKLIEKLKENKKWK